MPSANFTTDLSKNIACSGVTLFHLFLKPTQQFPRKTMGIVFALLISIPILNQAFAISTPSATACTAQPYDLPRNKWVQISLPCVPDSSTDTVKDIFGDDIAGDYGIDWKVYRYDFNDNLNHDLGEAGRLVQGEAYWIISAKAQASLNMPSNSQASKAKVDITLPTRSDSTSWYHYGFPYEQAQSWGSHRITTSSGDCATDDGCTPAQAQNFVSEQVYRWNGTGYDKLDANALLKPWGGYWVATLPAGHGLDPILHIQNSVNPDKPKPGKAYIPGLDFSKKDIYDNGQVVYVNNTKELEDSIINAKPHTSIILKDDVKNGGVYSNVKIRFPKGLHHITLKAENKHKGIIQPFGWDDNSAFIFSRADNPEESIHDINFIGLEVRGGDTLAGQFIKSEGGATYSVYHIYLHGLKIHDLRTGVYSGLHSHDWTMDACEVYDLWDNEHAWYMMGWNHAVINSIFSNGSHDMLALRGYYPDGEKHTYISEGDTACKGNKYVKDRVNREGFLDQKDWTHYVANNRFLPWNLQTSHESNSNTHIAIAYGLYGGDAECGNEKVYLPPQNIEIVNNYFSNEGEAEEAQIRAIQVDAWEGIYNDSLASINGIRIFDNTFIRDKDTEEFIHGVSDNDELYPKTDTEKIEAGNNTIVEP